MIIDDKACIIAINLTAKEPGEPGVIAKITVIDHDSGEVVDRKTLDYDRYFKPAAGQLALDHAHFMAQDHKYTQVKEISTNY